MNSRFKTRLQRAEGTAGMSGGAFVLIPKTVSDTLPRRGRTSVTGTLNGHAFRARLEPDGQLGHWLPVDESLRKVVGAGFGDEVALDLAPLTPEPEPELPAELLQALQANADAWHEWQATTTLARVDWIHWVESARQAATRTKRIGSAVAMLASGKRRVCCFDPSGHYSKAFAAPKPAAEA